MKLDIKATALAFGIGWGLGVLFLAWASALGWGSGLVELIGTYYLGYAPTFLGGIIGLLWGFVDGAVCGAIIAWLYNKFAN